MQKKPTIANLAAAAKVSVATINRLLHGSGPVRPDTADRILAAADDIGFYGLGALRSRSRDNLPHRRFCFIMQQSHRKLYQLWARALVAAASQRADAVIEPEVVFEDDLSPEAIAATLQRAGETADAISIISADHPLISQAIDRLRMKEVPVVAYVSDLSAASRAGFVGTDNWKIGRTAGWFVSQIAQQPGKVVSLIGSNRYQCQDVADASFRSYLREVSPGLQVGESLLTQEEPETAYQLVHRLLSDSKEVTALFVNGGGISGVLRAVSRHYEMNYRRICIVCRDIGPDARAGLTEGLISAAIRHPEDRMSQVLIDVMLRLVDRQIGPAVEQRIVPFEVVTPESLWT